MAKKKPGKKAKLVHLAIPSTHPAVASGGPAEDIVIAPKVTEPVHAEPLPAPVEFTAQITVFETWFGGVPYPVMAAVPNSAQDFPKLKTGQIIHFRLDNAPASIPPAT